MHERSGIAYTQKDERQDARAESSHGLRWEIVLTVAAIAVTVLASVLSVADIWSVLTDGIHAGSLARSLGQVVFLAIVGFLIYGALVYQFTRLGHLRRQLGHRPVPTARLARLWEEPSPPTLTILIPSYKEAAGVVWKTMVSAALQEYPRRRVVLLIDDPPHPTDPGDAAMLAAARRLPDLVQSLLADARKPCEAALEAFLERRASARPDLDAEGRYLARLLEDLAGWFEEQANRHEIVDHVDRLFVQLTLRGPAEGFRRAAGEWAGGVGPGRQRPTEQALLDEYTRLLGRFQVDVSSFERKRYLNLSREANKAMNLNSYIGLMGGSYGERPTTGGILLQPAAPETADVTVPDADFVLMVDADSVLAPEYALRLIHFMRQPGNRRVAVAQTPYSAFPGPPGLLERIAGATTDIQYFVHQGFTYYGATFWVGANAVVRKSALEDIAERDEERGYPITRFVQDRTVIEDTESSIDLADRGWWLYNYPERLAFSATPPDFGALLIQRRRWANGGLIILRKLLRHVVRRIGEPGIVREGLMRCHYLTSIAAVNIGLPVILSVSFEDSLRGYWLPLTALPYYALYMRDLQRAGYRAGDLLRVYALNLALIPVNLAGVFRSIYQLCTGRKSPFGRTPKVTGRTLTPALYLLAEFGLLAAWLSCAAADALHGRPLHAAFALGNTLFLGYAIRRFIGFRESWADLGFAWRQWLPRRAALRRARLAIPARPSGARGRRLAGAGNVSPLALHLAGPNAAIGFRPAGRAPGSRTPSRYDRVPEATNGGREVRVHASDPV